eukprot:tig00001292_g8039.t1
MASSWKRNANYAFTGKAMMFDDPRRFPPSEGKSFAPKAGVQRDVAALVIGGVDGEAMESLKFVLKKSKDDGQTLNLKWFDEKNYRGIQGVFDIALLVITDRARKDFSASGHDYPFLDFLASLAGEDFVYVVVPSVNDIDVPACCGGLANDAMMDTRPRLRRAFEGGRCLVWGRKQGQEKITEAVGRIRRGLYTKAAPPPPPPQYHAPSGGASSSAARQPVGEPYYGETAKVSVING